MSLQGQLDVPEVDVAFFKAHYSNLMYKAILKATQRSFAAMKRRLGSKTSERQAETIQVLSWQGEASVRRLHGHGNV